MKTIGLCFLTKNTFTGMSFYTEYLKNVSTDKYCIYIHYKQKPVVTFNNYKFVNTITTKWGNISLVKATIILFETAFQDNCDMCFLLSDDHYP